MASKPLVILTTFNRIDETKRTLAALEKRTDLNKIKLVIVDNGSTDGTGKYVLGWITMRLGWPFRGNPVDPIIAYLLRENIGCPQALNLALQNHRQPGQPVVKLDNDVRILTPGWVEKVRGLIAEREARGQKVAMVGAWYAGALEGRLRETVGEYEGEPLHRASPIIGHAVWHTGAFMDEVGYFDVLADDHLYGFEDLILSHKADVMGWETLVWQRWEIENIQRHSALGKGRDDHVEAMRPLYGERIAALVSGGSVWTGPDGRPTNHREETCKS
jgi:glycosyltransferase involved in cell wall biosynthesis